MPSVCKVLNFYSSSRNRKTKMSNEKMVNVIVNDRRFVPYVNKRGPILQPVSIPERVATALKNQGFNIVMMGTPKKAVEENTTKRIIVNKPVEPVKKEEVPVQEKPEPVKDEAKAIIDEEEKLNKKEEEVPTKEENEVIEDDDEEELPEAQPEKKEIKSVVSKQTNKNNNAGKRH